MADRLREAAQAMLDAAATQDQWDATFRAAQDALRAALNEPAPALDVEAHPFTLEMFDALQEVLAAHIYETSGDQGDRYFCRMCDAEVTTNDPHADGCEYMLLRRWTLDVAHARAVAAYAKEVTHD